MTKVDNPELFRENIAKKLETILEDNKLSINVEKAIFNYAIKEANSKRIVKKWFNTQFVQLYIDRLRTIWSNLKNDEFSEKIKSGDITPEDLLKITHQEMKPDRWRELIDKKIKRDESKFVNRTQASTDMFKCRKCHKTRCTYYSLQIRSSDEPETIFVTCLDCGCNFTR